VFENRGIVLLKKDIKLLIVDQNKEVINWVKTLANNQIGAAHLDLSTFEVASGMNNELIMISAETFNQLNSNQREKIEVCSAVLILNLKAIEIINPTQNIVGVIDSHLNQNILVQQISNLEEFIKSNDQLKSQLISLNMELNEIIGGVEDQLYRVKRAYENNAPRRLEEFQGFRIYSKYAAGDDMGGEFFDLLAKENKIFVMMSATSSYLASSSILQLFTELKALEEITQDDERDFINKVKEQVESLSESQGKEVRAQLLTCILDLNTLEMQGHVFGNFKVISSDVKNNREFSSSIALDFEQAKFKRKIQRGERIMLCSPGFVMNWIGFNPKFMIEELVTNKKIKVLDILDEIYFQLKKDAVDGFLKSDASSIIMEVQDNVMLEI
jgi:hypothetical protein